MTRYIKGDDYMEISSALFSEVYGNKRAIIDGCDSIVDFSEEEIIVKSGRLYVNIEGKNLKIKVLIDKSAVIEGFIIAIKFSYL